MKFGSRHVTDVQINNTWGNYGTQIRTERILNPCVLWKSRNTVFMVPMIEGNLFVIVACYYS